MSGFTLYGVSSRETSSGGELHVNGSDCFFDVRNFGRADDWSCDTPVQEPRKGNLSWGDSLFFCNLKYCPQHAHVVIIC